MTSELWSTKRKQHLALLKIQRRAQFFFFSLRGFVVDSTDLMMTSSPLPPTQKTHAEPLLVYILSSPGDTALQQADKAVGFLSALRDVTDANLILKSGNMQHL